MLPTIIVASIIAFVFIAIIVNEIRKKKSGRSSCSCGGNCGSCSEACAIKPEGKDGET